MVIAERRETQGAAASGQQQRRGRPPGHFREGTAAGAANVTCVKGRGKEENVMWRSSDIQMAEDWKKDQCSVQITESIGGSMLVA